MLTLVVLASAVMSSNAQIEAEVALALAMAEKTVQVVQKEEPIWYSWEEAHILAKSQGKHVICFNNCEPPDGIKSALPDCVIAKWQGDWKGKPYTSSITVKLNQGGKFWFLDNLSPSAGAKEIKSQLDRIQATPPTIEQPVQRNSSVIPPYRGGGSC